MIEDITKDTKARMLKSVEALVHDLSKVRTGRAHPSLLDQVMVPYYGSDVPINQVANVSAEDARTLMVTPWEQKMVATVDKAIRTSDLGLNPSVAGNVIRVPLPPLTEERRKEAYRRARQADRYGAGRKRKGLDGDLKVATPALPHWRCRRCNYLEIADTGYGGF